MAKGGSTPSSTTQTTKTEPWGPSQPHLQNIMSSAQQLYQSGAGNSYFPGSTVVPFSPQTEAGLTALENQAMGGAPLYDQAFGAAGQAMQGGAGNPAAGAAAGAAYGMDLNSAMLRGASAQTNPFHSEISMAGWAPTQGAGVNQLNAAANGAWMGGNPLLQAQFDQGASSIRNQVGAAFQNSGMYGSAAHRDNLGGALGNLWTGLASNVYNTERGLMQDAAMAQAGIAQNDLSRALSGATANAGFAGDDLTRALTGAGMSADYNMQGIQQLGDIWSNGATQAMVAAGMLPSLYEYGQMPANQLLQAGGAREEMGQLQLQDAMNRFNFDQNAPYAALDRYRAAIGELPLQGLGTSTATGTAQRASNPLLGILGGASGGAGIASALGATGPLGWGIMGLGALLGGLG